MDRGKRKENLLGMANNKIYMDLKDIIREHALAFLPAKSLMRFQSVCRGWKLLIATPFFAHNQSQSCRSVLGLFCQAPGQPPLFVSFDSKSCGVPDPHLEFMPEPVEVWSSSNGLLCCRSSSDEDVYYICNPLTKQWKKLPKPNAHHGSNPAIMLVFEPSLLNFIAEYKLVCAFHSNDFDDAVEFEVYSSVDNSWKISGEICFNTINPIPGSGVYMNNVIYWKLENGYILAYDLIKDRSQRFYGAFYFGGRDGSGTLGNMNGKLCVANATGSSLSFTVLANVHKNTMEMSTGHKMWEQKQGVVLMNFAVSDDQEVVFAGGDVMVIRSSNTLYLYDLKETELKELAKLDSYGKRTFVPYVNSMVSI